MSKKPKTLFSTEIIFTERVRKCSECNYLSGAKCAKSDCKWESNTLFNLAGKCPANKW